MLGLGITGLVGCKPDSDSKTKINNLPTFVGFALTRDASADSKNLYIKSGENIQGRMIAVDAEGNQIHYQMDVTGDNALLASQKNDEFEINTTTPITTDTTSDLGKVTVNVCDEQNYDTATNSCMKYNQRTFGIVGTNSSEEPIKIGVTKTFDESGNVMWSAGIVSKNFIKNATEYFNDHEDEKTFDVAGMGNYNEITLNKKKEIKNNNSAFYSVTDFLGNEDTTTDSFVPATKSKLLELIDAELSARGITPSDNQPSGITLGDGKCSELSPRDNNMTAERLFSYNGKSYQIRVADFSSSTDVANAKTSSLYFNCKDLPTLAETSQFFIGNPVSSVSKIMEDYLGVVVE